MVIGIFDGAGKVFDCLAQSLETEDVGDGVRALVGGAVDGVLRAWNAFVVGDGGPGF